MGEPGEVQALLARVERRLREVLTLISEAPIDCTTIASDSGGGFQGNDWFIGTRLRDEADTLLRQWDREDEDDEDDTPPPTAGGPGAGTADGVRTEG